MEKPVSSEAKAQKKPSKAKPVPKPRTQEPIEPEIRLAATPAQHAWLKAYAEATVRTNKEVVLLAVREFMVRHEAELTKLERQAAKLEALSLIHI